MAPLDAIGTLHSLEQQVARLKDAVQELKQDQLQDDAALEEMRTKLAAMEADDAADAEELKQLREELQNATNELDERKKFAGLSGVKSEVTTGLKAGFSKGMKLFGK